MKKKDKKTPLTEEEIQKRERLKKKAKKERKRFFIKAGVIAGIILILYFFIVGFVPQHGNQMFPAIKDGDFVITLRVGQTYQTNAVVCYLDPDDNKRIGRIIAMPGDTIDINEEGRVIVNDMMLSEEIFYPTEKEGTKISELPYTVPEGSYYILNDHRSETDDSRSYGAITEDKMYGMAFWMFRRRSF